MPHLSQRILDSKTRKQITETLELVLGKLNKAETNTFLFSILSETERLMLAKRLAIALLINAGVDHLAIAENLCVTKETVSRIDLALMKRPQGFALAEKKIDEDKMMQDLKKALIKLASYSIKAAGGRVDL